MFSLNDHDVLVSVLVPAFNHEKYVQETIRSVINQTYKNIELLVIDDGSTDNTWNKICALRTHCEQRFTNVFFDSQYNRGTCETLNRLILEAKGKYYCIVASDDLLKPNAIGIHVDFLEKNPSYVLSVGNDELIDSDSKRVGWDENIKIVDIDNARYKTFADCLSKFMGFDFKSKSFGSYKTFINQNYIPNGYLIRSSAIKQIGGFKKEAPIEDWYLHLQLSKIGKYNYFDEILASYRWHDGNTVKRKEYMEAGNEKNNMYEGMLVRYLKEKKWLKVFLREKGRFPYYFRLNLFYLIKVYFSINEKNIEFLSYRITIKKID